jgi:dipeptidyl aminopeptidase/acylaminoacyl peptidase
MTVRDSIEKVTFAEDPARSPKDQVAVFSPDGKYFSVITTCGVLKSDEMESTVWLYDAAAVTAFTKSSSGGHAPVGRKIATVATHSNGEAITLPRWSADSENISFLGRNKTVERRLFTVNIKDAQLKQISPERQDVTLFDRSKDTFLFTTVPPVSEAQLYESAGPALPDQVIGPGNSLFQLLFPEWENFTFGGHPNQVWISRNGSTSVVKSASASTPISLVRESYGAVLSLSPDGRYAVVTNAVAHVPSSWESYEVGYQYKKIIADKPGVKPLIDHNRATEYQLIDLQTDKVSPLLDAPSGMSAGFVDTAVALWSADSRNVIVTNTFLPQDGKRAAGLPHSLRPWVAAVNVESKQISPIKETPLRDDIFSVLISGIDWQGSKQRLAIHYLHPHDANAPDVELFEKEGASWKLVTDQDATRAAASQSVAGHGLSISVRQSVNEPPVLVAASGESEPKKLWDPNPQFARINFGEAALYKWKDEDGSEWTGGLVKPPDYVEGKRYPLVLQTHGFNDREFLTDGIFPTANAARPMAGRGLVVLQIGEIHMDDKIMETPKEPETVRKGYVAAIQKLDSEGLIDPHKVGIIGFSRTGWYVLDSLLHAKEYFAAATLAECTYISFGEYIMNADYGGPGRAKSIASGIGPEPFGEGLQEWLAKSAGFNTDKIEAAILYEAHYPPALLYSWDMYALMRLQNKPVDLLYFRNGEHVLVKPKERLASQEMNVDWYDFWLNGHEDSDPAKADQYARWRELRKQKESQQ